MSPYTLTAIVVFATAALMHARGARPPWLFGLAGLGFLAAGVTMDLIPALLDENPQPLRITSTTRNGRLHDTYYVASQLNFARPVGTLLLAVTAFLTLQQVLGAMYQPRLTRWLFWPFAGGLALAPIVQTLTLGQIPRRYTEVADRFSAAHTLEVTLAYITYAAGGLLLALFLGSLLWRLKTALHRAK